ncbi:MAG TPA: hypothetical protein DEQ02_03320 [Ruminococcaceae bacterium]|nr:hypothetical protein [Oscillospiraceae bacterium]
MITNKVDFAYAELSDKPWVDELLACSSFRGCEYCFGNLYIWRIPNELKIARINDFITAKSLKRQIYLFPAGSGDLKAVIKALMRDADECGHPFVLYGICEEAKVQLNEIMPGRFEFEAYESGFDYIYESKDLITLSGKKYHSKRNHIARFKENNNYVYERVSGENLSECVRMNKEWCKQHGCLDDEGLTEEACAVATSLRYFDELGFQGGLIRVDGRVVAYTIGERLSQDTYCIHIEKAFGDIQGAYAMINQCFASDIAEDVKYINREEDTGAEGLRKAKRSYYPAIWLTKYFAKLIK